MKRITIFSIIVSISLILLNTPVFGQTRSASEGYVNRATNSVTQNVITLLNNYSNTNQVKRWYANPSNWVEYTGSNIIYGYTIVSNMTWFFEDGGDPLPLTYPLSPLNGEVNGWICNYYMGDPSVVIINWNYGTDILYPNISPTPVNITTMELGGASYSTNIFCYNVESTNCVLYYISSAPPLTSETWSYVDMTNWMATGNSGETWVMEYITPLQNRLNYHEFTATDPHSNKYVKISGETNIINLTNSPHIYVPTKFIKSGKDAVNIDMLSNSIDNISYLNDPYSDNILSISNSIGFITEKVPVNNWILDIKTNAYDFINGTRCYGINMKTDFYINEPEYSMTNFPANYVIYAELLIGEAGLLDIVVANSSVYAPYLMSDIISIDSITNNVIRMYDINNMEKYVGDFYYSYTDFTNHNILTTKSRDFDVNNINFNNGSISNYFWGNEIIVDASGKGHFSTIQAAVDYVDSIHATNASLEVSVRVVAGTYYENVVVNKARIILRGDDRRSKLLGSITFLEAPTYISGFYLRSTDGITTPVQYNNISSSTLSLVNNCYILNAISVDDVASCLLINSPSAWVNISASELYVQNINSGSSAKAIPIILNGTACGAEIFGSRIKTSSYFDNTRHNESLCSLSGNASLQFENSVWLTVHDSIPSAIVDNNSQIQWIDSSIVNAVDQNIPITIQGTSINPIIYYSKEVGNLKVVGDITLGSRETYNKIFSNGTNTYQVDSNFITNRLRTIADNIYDLTDKIQPEKNSLSLVNGTGIIYKISGPYTNLIVTLSDDFRETISDSRPMWTSNNFPFVDGDWFSDKDVEMGNITISHYLTDSYWVGLFPYVIDHYEEIYPITLNTLYGSAYGSAIVDVGNIYYITNIIPLITTNEFSKAVTNNQDYVTFYNINIKSNMLIEGNISLGTSIQNKQLGISANGTNIYQLDVNGNTNRISTDFNVTNISQLLSISSGTIYERPDLVPSPDAWFTFDGTNTITYYNGPRPPIDVDIVIPYQINGKTVTKIGDHSFSSITFSEGNIGHIYMPNTIIELGHESFPSYPGKIHLSKNLKLIDRGAFDEAALAFIGDVVIPEGVTNIGDYAFEYCTYIQNFTIGKNVTHIGNFVFGGFGYHAPANIYWYCDKPTVGEDIFTSSPLNSVTNIIMNPNATGWGSTFEGMPVIRLPLFGSDITANNTLNVNGNATFSNDVFITGNISTLGTLKFTNTLQVIDEIGEVGWDRDEKTVSIRLDEEVTGQVFLESFMMVTNITDKTISNGYAVCALDEINGKTVATPVTSTNAACVNARKGIVTQDIPPYGYGRATERGDIHSLNTLGYNKNDFLYATMIPWTYTNVVPPFPEYPIVLGRVSTVSETEGVIKVYPVNNQRNSETLIGTYYGYGSKASDWSYDVGARVLSNGFETGTSYNTITVTGATNNQVLARFITDTSRITAISGGQNVKLDIRADVSKLGNEIGAIMYRFKILTLNGNIVSYFDSTVEALDQSSVSKSINCPILTNMVFSTPIRMMVEIIAKTELNARTFNIYSEDGRPFILSVPLPSQQFAFKSELDNYVLKASGTAANLQLTGQPTLNGMNIGPILTSAITNRQTGDILLGDLKISGTQITWVGDPYWATLNFFGGSQFIDTILASSFGGNYDVPTLVANGVNGGTADLYRGNEYRLGPLVYRVLHNGSIMTSNNISVYGTNYAKYFSTTNSYGIGPLIAESQAQIFGDGTNTYQVDVNLKTNVVVSSAIGNNQVSYLWKGSNSEFQAISEVDSNTLYAVTDDQTVFDTEGIYNKVETYNVLTDPAETEIVLVEGKSVYDVNVYTNAVITFNAEGLNFSEKEAEFKLVFHITETNIPSLTFAEGIQFAQIPEYTVTGNYENVVSTRDGTNYLIRQTYPTIYEKEGWPLIRSDYALTAWSFEADNFYSYLQAPASSAKSCSVTLIKQQEGLMKVSLSYLWYCDNATTLTNVTGTTFLSFIDGNENLWRNIQTNLVSLPAQDYINTRVVKVVDAGEMYGNNRMSYFFVMTLLNPSDASAGFLNRLERINTYCQRLNELEIKAYNAGWRP